MGKTRERNREERMEQAAYDILASCRYLISLTMAEDFDKPGAYKSTRLAAEAIELLITSQVLDEGPR
tara:strand:+ start:582 stop:782 length:201 start_codon:yes stop_codon:yes gene_type:complete